MCQVGQSVSQRSLYLLHETLQPRPDLQSVDHCVYKVLGLGLGLEMTLTLASETVLVFGLERETCRAVFFDDVSCHGLLFVSAD